MDLGAAPMIRVWFARKTQDDEAPKLGLGEDSLSASTDVHVNAYFLLDKQEKVRRPRFGNRKYVYYKSTRAAPIGRCHLPPRRLQRRVQIEAVAEVGELVTQPADVHIRG